jgi:copper chaperone CopZ
MNFKKSMLTVVLASVLFTGCKDKLNETDSKEITTTDIPQIKENSSCQSSNSSFFCRRTCAVGCAKTIQEDLTQLEGVQATVDFETKIATVTFDKTVQNPEKLTTVVEAAADGKTYKVTNMKL